MKWLFTLLVPVPFICFGQDAATPAKVKHSTGKMYTPAHKSITVNYGFSTLFVDAPYNTGSTAQSTKGSFSSGPLAVLYNRGLTKDLSLSVGGVYMYHRDSYKYTYEASGMDREGTSHLNLFAGTFGFDYHFATRKKVDTYFGASTGVGQFWGRGGADQLGLRYKGKTVVLYGAKVGLNLLTCNNSAFNFELGYDFLSYAKIGYTFIKRK